MGKDPAGLRRSREPLRNFYLRQNQFAYLACQGKDASVARELFLRIGDHWDKGTWKTQKFFESCKKWASWMAARIDIAVSSAATNIQTAEGHQYDAQITTVFNERLTKAIEGCAARASKDAHRFDLFVLFNEQGSPQTFLAQPQTAVSDCLRPQVQALMFPPPPKPDYWLKINLGSLP